MRHEYDILITEIRVYFSVLKQYQNSVVTHKGIINRDPFDTIRQFFSAILLIDRIIPKAMLKHTKADVP